MITTMIVSIACLLTAGGVSGPGVEPSCLGTANVNDETVAEIEGDTTDASVVVNGS